MQNAGAAAIELNVYYLPVDPLPPARAAEIGYAEIFTRVKAAVSIPVAVKMAPYSGAPGETVFILDHAGAGGLALFNRFLQADIDPETLTVSAGFRLSSPARRRCHVPGSACCAGGCAARWRCRPAWRPRPTSPPTCWPARTW
jgi:dihydroorotate dehydrogenase (fumarate)